MLLENFYKIIHIKEREDGKQAIEIELNPGHVLYQGHFPGQPVVPGVCTLQIIKARILLFMMSWRSLNLVQI